MSEVDGVRNWHEAKSALRSESEMDLAVVMNGKKLDCMAWHVEQEWNMLYYQSLIDFVYDSLKIQPADLQ